MWTFETRNDPDVLMAFVIRRLERHGLPWVRESIALAEGPADLDGVVEKVLALRVLGLHYADRMRDRRDPRLERLLPVERVLESFQVQSDGVMTGDRVDAIERHPIGILGLDAGWHAVADLDRFVPLARALRWARHDDRGASGATLLEAAAVFRAEQRWLATFDPLNLDNPLVRRNLDYDTILHGLTHLFDPRLMETLLAELPMKNAPLGRIVRALKKAPFDSDAETLAGLPKRCGRLTALPNMGQATMDMLKVALIKAAGGWREARFGIEAARLLPSSEAASDALRGGLDDLAALFE